MKINRNISLLGIILPLAIVSCRNSTKQSCESVVLTQDNEPAEDCIAVCEASDYINPFEQELPVKIILEDSSNPDEIVITPESIPDVAGKIVKIYLMHPNSYSIVDSVTISRNMFDSYKSWQKTDIRKFELMGVDYLGFENNVYKFQVGICVFDSDLTDDFYYYHTEHGDSIVLDESYEDDPFWQDERGDSY